MLKRLLAHRTLVVEAVRQLILWLVVMNLVTLTPDQHNQTISLASIVLALFSVAFLEEKPDA
jgi:hypothetical protein